MSPNREGWFWAKLLRPSGMSTVEDWASSDWEIVQVVDNNGQGEEEFMVSVGGIAQWQRRCDCIFGPEVIRPADL